MISGNSGVGKSTLIKVISAMQPFSGSYRFRDMDVASLSQQQKDEFRAQHIGLALQQTHYIASLSVLENLMLAQLPSRKQNKSKILELLEKLGLENKVKAKCQQLSGGELQRFNFIRALLSGSSLMLVDEPSANLDDAHTQTLMDTLLQLCEEEGRSLIAVSHDARIKNRFQNVLKL